MMYSPEHRAADTEGVDPALVAQMEAEREARGEDVDIWPENQEAVEVFFACSTQWRTSMAGATGLEYPAVESVMRLRAVEDPADCFDRVQVMEREALKVMGENRRS